MRVSIYNVNAFGPGSGKSCGRQANAPILANSTKDSAMDALVVTQINMAIVQTELAKGSGRVS